MNNDVKIALGMLGETIDFYNDNGTNIEIALDENVDGAIDVYDKALKSIQKRYDVVMKLIKGDK